MSEGPPRIESHHLVALVVTVGFLFLRASTTLLEATIVAVPVLLAVVASLAVLGRYCLRLLRYHATGE